MICYGTLDLYFYYRDQRWSTSGLLQDDVLQCNNTVQRRYLLSDTRGKISYYQCNGKCVLENLILDSLKTLFAYHAHLF